VVKITSGSSPEAARFVDALYRRIVRAGTHAVSSIRVAEAAKVIENSQRDLNIALVNELALIFQRLGIDTLEVLEAAGTKWNFLPFRPGLVGGHCIGVDPYYLTHKAERVGYIPQVILAGRRINDGMGSYIAQQTVKQMVRAGHPVAGSRVTVLGLTFKEDCPDLRNSRVIDIIRELRDYRVDLQVCDPQADPDEARREHGVALTPLDALRPASAVVFAVAHHEFARWSLADHQRLLGERGVVIDVKSICDAARLRGAGVPVWRL
jgi:UDP-N-acetyl-D-galactosamine dehydrogenase